MLRNFDLKGFVYLRSDGFLEYKIKYGIVGYYLYFIMFYLIKKKLKIISCSKTLIMLILEILFTRQSLMRVGLKKKKQNRFQTIYYLLEGLKRKKE